ncbi:MAG: DUF1080 domain-containing protein [Fuerstiella sp.]
MNRLHTFVALTLIFTCSLATAQDRKKAFLNSKDAGNDFEIQGEYSGMVGDSVKVGIQVIARGNGKFDSVGYIGGLPGDGWNPEENDKIPGTGMMKDGVCVLKPNPSDDGNATGYGEIKDGVFNLYDANNQRVAELAKVVRESSTLKAKPPEGAVVLFDGSDVEQWKNGRLSDDKLLMEGCTSKQNFGSYQLHLEFQLSFMPWATGQGRANSGCYNQGRYEVQVLDSFGLTGEDNECGGLYKIAKPKVNMCFPPLSWQTYDIEFEAAKFDDSGQKKADAWITVRHNDVVIHEKQTLPNRTTASPLKESSAAGPIFLQNHGNPIRFRNIWVKPTDSK